MCVYVFMSMICACVLVCQQIYMSIYGVASKFGYGSARGDPNVWNSLDHLRFGMDRGLDRPVGSGYGSGLYILTRSHIYIIIYISRSIMPIPIIQSVDLSAFLSFIFYLPPPCLSSLIILSDPLSSNHILSDPIRFNLIQFSYQPTYIIITYIQLMSLSAYRTAPPKLLPPVFPKQFPSLLISPAGNAWRYPPGPLGSCSGGMPNRAHQSGSPQLRSAQTVFPSSLLPCWPNPPASPGEVEGVERAGNGDPKLKTCGVSQNFMSKMRI